MEVDVERRKRRIIILMLTLIIQHLSENLSLLLELFHLNQIQTLQLFHRNLEPRITIDNYVEQINRFSDWQFQEDFRLTRTTFDTLESIVCRYIKQQQTTKPFTPTRTQLLATIWLLGTPESYRSVSERFGLQKSTLYVCILRLVKVLCHLSSHFIRWPNENEQNRIKRNFNRYGLPGVVGAVDGSFIYCSEPKNNGNAYNTRKCRHAIQLQAIAITNLQFTDIFTGYPGSVGDYRIFRNSHIYEDIERNPVQFFPQDGHILGDKAYPLKTWCITPYKDNGRLSQEQRNFNRIHSSSRCVIERAFCLLKGRFRRLKHLEIIRHDLAPYYILASCVLHNICIDVGDDDIERYIESCPTVARNNNNNDDEHEIPQEASTAAVNKRNYLCSFINQ